MSDDKKRPMITVMRPDFTFADERGLLIQLVHEGFTQVNVVRSCAGVVRGGHHHDLNREAFYVIEGAFDVTVSLPGRTEKYSFTSGDMFAIEKGVSHSFEYKEDTLLVGLYDAGVVLADGSKDIIAD